MQPDSINFHEDAHNDPSSFNQHEAPSQGVEETCSLLSKSSGSCPGDILYEEDEAKNAKDHDSHDVDIRGLALLSHMKFYLLWLLLGLLTGIGLMTINNIGSDVSLPFFLLVLFALLTFLTGQSDMAPLRRQCLLRIHTGTTIDACRDPVLHELLWAARKWYVNAAYPRSLTLILFAQELALILLSGSWE